MVAVLPVGRASSSWEEQCSMHRYRPRVYSEFCFGTEWYSLGIEVRLSYSSREQESYIIRKDLTEYHV